jgi:hypothetical protein
VAEARVDGEVVFDAPSGQLRAQLLDVVHAHARVLVAPEADQRSFDGGALLRAHLGREPVEAGRHAVPPGQLEHVGPAHAEADGAQALEAGGGLQPVQRGVEVGERLLVVQAAAPLEGRFARLLGERALAEEVLRVEGREAGQRQAAGQVLVERGPAEDVVDHQHGAAGGAFGLGEQGGHRLAGGHGQVHLAGLDFGD